MINQIKGKVVRNKLVKTRAKKLIMRLFYSQNSEKSSKSNLSILRKKIQYFDTIHKLNQMINQPVICSSRGIGTSSFGHSKRQRISFSVAKARGSNFPRYPSHRLIYHCIQCLNYQNIEFF